MRLLLGSIPLLLLVACAPVGGDDDDPGPMQTDCGSTHEKVGWSADLATYFHDVSGRAEVVDDCTISIPDFSYDGEGVDVRFYVAQDDDFGSGRAISRDILGEVYDDESITLPLPEGVSLDDVGWLSLWCVRFSADFGSGEFVPPALGR